jgi:peptidoglycan hydrolase CwlO-like protein
MVKQFFQKLKTKDWAIVVLTVLLIIFSGYFFFSSSNYKSQLRNLKNTNDSLELEQKKIGKILEQLKDSAKTYRTNIKDLQTKIDKSEKDLKVKEAEINKAKKDLNHYKNDYDKTKKEIQKLEQTPLKRTGESLLNSLKEKTK